MSVLKCPMCDTVNCSKCSPNIFCPSCFQQLSPIHQNQLLVRSKLLRITMIIAIGGFIMFLGSAFIAGNFVDDGNEFAQSVLMTLGLLGVIQILPTLCVAIIAKSRLVGKAGVILKEFSEGNLPGWSEF